jgi:hypothetical protein
MADRHDRGRRHLRRAHSGHLLGMVNSRHVFRRLSHFPISHFRPSYIHTAEFRKSDILSNDVMSTFSQRSTIWRAGNTYKPSTNCWVDEIRHYECQQFYIRQYGSRHRDVPNQT